MTKAIALLSGGLDSILAVRLMQEQGIELEALNFLTVFCNCTSQGKTCLASKSAADNLGIKLKVMEVSKEYFKIIKNPKHGYGRNINPCLDCRIFMFKKTKEYMKESGAEFIITGEVLGQRPMSQRRDAMNIIEKESGLEGLILRPLSAKLFKPTIPEKAGLVDREKLLAVEGRSRKIQIEMADGFGINDYPCPAGGCLLTDPGFARKMKDLMKHKPRFTVNDVKFLKAGRCFRLSKKAVLVVGRNEQENESLLKLAKDKDVCFTPIEEIAGPTAIGIGVFNKKDLNTAASIVARYSDGTPDKKYEIIYKKIAAQNPKMIIASPIKEITLENLRI